MAGENDKDDAAAVKDLLDQEPQTPPPEVLDAVEQATNDLPPSFTDRVLAQELLAFLRNIVTLKVGIRGARSYGHNAKAEELGKELGYCQHAAAVIMWKHPGAKALAKEIAAQTAAEAERADRRAKATS